jgi:hypothetical protein
MMDINKHVEILDTIGKFDYATIYNPSQNKS